MILLKEKTSTQTKLELIAKYVRGVAAESKRAGGRDRRRQRLIDISEKNYNLLFHGYLLKALSNARNKLKDIMNTYALDEAKEAGSFNESLKKKKLMQKWFLNFMAAIIFLREPGTSSYRQLQVPTATEMIRVQDTAFDDFFSFRCNSDKKDGDVSFPSVLFSISIKPFVEFHKRVIHAYLRNKLNFVNKGIDVRLSMHWRDGTCLCARHTTHSFRTFMVYINRRYELVTYMVVCASLATSMMHDYRNGRIGAGLSEPEFLR
ncbi:hypothetical protein FGB62_275g04 [Gracilaria domingensis]|nr:hypothetical protein FGB62_275g04 [Gracilaria domingensis]